MNMEEQLRSVVDKATADGELWHTIIHGTATTEVPTENGQVPSVAKQLKDVRDAIVGGVIDVVSRAETARDIALEAQSQTETLKSDTQIICDTAEGFKNATEGFKNQSQSTFNNIVPATNAAILSVETAGDGQVALVQSSALEQIELAKNEADRAKEYADSLIDQFEQKADFDLSNASLSQKFRDLIGNLWLFNYSARISIPANSAYTAPSNGVIFINRTGNFTITVNGVGFPIGGRSSNYEASDSNFFPIKAGWGVNVPGNGPVQSQVAYFIPFGV